VKSSMSRRSLILGAGTVGLAGAFAVARRLGVTMDTAMPAFAAVDQGASERLEKLVFHAGSRARNEPDRAKTSEESFPAYFLGDAPPAIPEGWRLEVGGMSSRKLSLTLDDLQRLPRTDLRVRHYCVEGWSAVADWHGVQLSELARICGADAKAACVQFDTFDVDKDGTAYSTSWDRESAMHAQTILAYGMNGKPLSAQHGAPVRLYSGVKLGYKTAKYLTSVKFTPDPTGGYWEDQGYEWFAGV
jgi:DMSO/TMAO reductase YedYZ molybdopterin-dependent catalytic subunit